MFKCKYCNKEFENGRKLGGHTSCCKLNPNRVNSPKRIRTVNYNAPSLIPRNDLFCRYCGKQCKNINSLNNHERLCRDNPDTTLTSRKSGFLIAYENCWDPAWNRGLTKETDERVAKNAKGVSNYYINHNGSFKGHHHTEETKQQISSTMVEKGLGGICKRKLIEYNGVVLESTYELEVAKSLDENGVKWVKVGKKFKYIDSVGKKHTYVPDFYLPEYDVYLDPKNDYLINMINPKLGYKDIDKISWVMEQNSIRVIVLDKTALSWSSIKGLIKN